MTRPLLDDDSGTAANAFLPARDKVAPQDRATRDAMAGRAQELVAPLERTRPLRRAELARLARELLARERLPRRLLGFAMVLVDNAFWRDQFARIPFSQRLLLLPHCLRNKDACPGRYDEEGLHCVGCGACDLGAIRREAEALGYTTLIAEGTPAVVRTVLGGKWEAVLGVACLDSLEKAFRRISEVGIPHAAVPLLRDGCEDTEVDLAELRSWMAVRSDEAGPRTRAYFPLLREAARLCDASSVAALLRPHVSEDALGTRRPADVLADVEFTGIEWLRRGGKRFRPFLTLAAFVALEHGEAGLRAGVPAPDQTPDGVRSLALAIEALHKASLAHDDVEDNDLYRYGVETLHRRYGAPIAINVGDYLVGLGYRLIASQSGSLGQDCVADILDRVAQAHVNLSRGQGMELALRRGCARQWRPIDLLRIYALKTAPAFEVSLYAGMRAVGPARFVEETRRFCRHLGVAYQALNDLKDWQEESHDKVVVGQDALASRPTILRAFANRSLTTELRGQLAQAQEPGAPQSAALAAFRGVYEATGAFDKVRKLVRKERERAEVEAAKVESAALRDLLFFVSDVMLSW